MFPGFLPNPGGGLPGLPTLPGLPPILPGGGGGPVNGPVTACTSGYCLPGGGNVGGISVDVGTPGNSGTIRITNPQQVQSIGLQSATYASAAGAVGSAIWNLFGTRFAFFILGLILIIAGLYMLKETRFIITTQIKAAKEGIKTAGEAAAA